MLEKLMRMYMMGMAYDVRSPMPHLVGPPGCGKSSVVEQLADLLEVKLHIINVSRMSPLEVEGVQMPHGSGEDMALRMLPATFWTSLKHGDILLMDEFLRGFPEVYNSLLDVFTSRRVGGFTLPRVFIIGASNSTTTYDAALEDRLLHLLVPDPRSSIREFNKLGKLLTAELGLLPSMATSPEMKQLLTDEVLPTYELLDVFKKKKGKQVSTMNSTTSGFKGTSMRNLIGQAQLRCIQSNSLKTLIDVNNENAINEHKYQYLLLIKHTVADTVVKSLRTLKDNSKLTALQRLNIMMNLQLIDMELAKIEKED